MIGLPWFLLAAGIGIVIIGSLMAALTNGHNRNGPTIDPRMRDEEIIRNLGRSQKLSWPSIIILLGLVCVFVSICWRFVRAVI